jgi:beta-lactam-binding protein with PASTA domain
VENIKHYLKRFYNLISSKIFLTNFIAFLGLILVSGFLFFGFINIYTDHGSKAAVPNFVGMELNRASGIAEKFDFNIEVTDSVFRIGKKLGEILLQSPEKGTIAKPGRTIYVTVSKNTPDEIILPDIALGNDDYNMYAKRLLMLGVKSSIISKKQDAKLENNTILDVLIDGKSILAQLKEGVKVAMGNTVGFVVSERESDVVLLDNFVCKTLEEAKFILEASNITIGNIVSNTDVVDKGSAFIFKQEPEYEIGLKINKNTPITVYLSKTKPENCTK